MSLAGLFMLACSVVALGSPGFGSAGGEDQPVEPGVVVYRANYCGICHELPAAGTRGTFGPSHEGMGEIAAGRLAEEGYGGAATTPAEYIAESILQPSVFLVPGYATSTHPMPSFAHLPESDIADLVNFLLSQ